VEVLAVGSCRIRQGAGCITSPACTRTAHNIIAPYISPHIPDEIVYCVDTLADTRELQITLIVKTRLAKGNGVVAEPNKAVPCWGFRPTTRRSEEIIDGGFVSSDKILQGIRRSPGCSQCS